MWETKAGNFWKNRNELRSYGVIFLILRGLKTTSYTFFHLVSTSRSASTLEREHFFTSGVATSSIDAVLLRYTSQMLQTHERVLTQQKLAS